jgi:acyl-coenzyme A synthetase/AMP-(fatty) acid ligase
VHTIPRNASGKIEKHLLRAELGQLATQAD